MPWECRAPGGREAPWVNVIFLEERVMSKMRTLIGLVAGLVLASIAVHAEGYRTSVGTGADEIPVVVVSGTPYEMGFALGQLTKTEIKVGLEGYMSLAQKAEPDRLSDAALDKAWTSISPYVDHRFTEEMKGLADGSGASYDKLIRGHMIPVVSDYACSGVAVWGDATKDGHLYQIRNLDYTVDGGLQDNPMLVVYRPTEGHAHILPTFAGSIGANTGMNDQGIALGEKGGSPESEYPFNLDGNHFMTLFRDILYDADSLAKAVDMIKTAKLIKRYHLYVGDGTSPDQGAVKVLVATPDPVPLSVWGDNDACDEVAPNVMKNSIYFTMNNEKAYEDLAEKSGKYDSQSMIALSRTLATKDGSLLTVVYDATSLELWVAYAEKLDGARNRPYVHVDMKDYMDPKKVPEGAIRLSKN
jgi:hypothetical protein